jgi:mono/diheme cytochrome c family protein
MRRLALFVPLLLASAGCVNGTVTTATPSKQVGTVATTPAPQVPSNGDPAAGKIVFKSPTASCFGCHTLKDAGSTGTIGPNLDDKKPAKALILERVLNGKSPMPAFKGTLTEKQIADVVAYVYSATHT